MFGVFSFISTSTLSYVLNSPFGSNFFSDLIILIMASFLLPSYLSYLKRPKKFALVFSQTGTTKIRLDDLNGSIKLSFCNNSNNSFENDIYWHIWIPTFLTVIPESKEKPNQIPISYIEVAKDDSYVHYSGKFPEPVYAKTTRAHYYEFKIKHIDNVRKEIIIYYFLSTEFGIYPKKISMDETGKIDDLTTCNKLYLV